MGKDTKWPPATMIVYSLKISNQSPRLTSAGLPSASQRSWASVMASTHHSP